MRLYLKLAGLIALAAIAQYSLSASNEPGNYYLHASSSASQRSTCPECRPTEPCSDMSQDLIPDAPIN